MKIIHTSDWHLGARLREEDRGEEHAAFLDWLAALMADERPDALVVAGDVFDVKAPSPQAQSLYYGFLARVAKDRLCRKVVVTAGNHDNWKLLAAPSRLLDELGVAVVSAADEDVSGEVVVVRDDGGRPLLAVAAVPFMYEADLANFGAAETGEDATREAKVAAGWRRHCEAAISAARAAAPGVPLVATGHATLLSAQVSDADSERCRRIGGMEAYDPAPLAAADYVALGHLHIPQRVKGWEDRMFYSGSPLRMSFDEAKGTKSVNVVTFDSPAGGPRVEVREVPETVPILTVSGTPDHAKSQLAELVAASRTEKRFVRVQLRDFEGEAKGHWAELRAIVADTATLVLEENDVRPVPRDAAGLRAFADRGIRQLAPREVAEQKLRGSVRRFGEEQIVELMGMFDEVAGGLR